MTNAANPVRNGGLIKLPVVVAAPAWVVMKPREPRHKVLVRARIKAGASWHDACILNISSRGMLMQAAAPPVRGSYLEIRRGAQVIVARVMWCKLHRFGIKSQDVLSIDAIVANPDVASTIATTPTVERRMVARPRWSAHDHSRWQGRLMEYGFVAALAVALGVFAANEVYTMLSKPADTITAALSGSERPR
ncbi:MAG: PilZ domain-containing protein [Sphingomonas bacterium]|nr:PilZ domain-containing protein [Sphingomonas bacterium]